MTADLIPILVALAMLASIGLGVIAVWGFSGRAARNENGPGGWALAIAIGFVGAWFLVEFAGR
jgi:hypothetical protein